MIVPTKVCLVKAMVFLVVMYECEIWTIKKVEHQRIDAFELWCSFCLPSDGEGQEAYGSFLMGETDSGGNQVLF